MSDTNTPPLADLPDPDAAPDIDDDNDDIVKDFGAETGADAGRKREEEPEKHPEEGRESPAGGPPAPAMMEKRRFPGKGLRFLAATHVDWPALTALWRRSVDATHSFLDEAYKDYMELRMPTLYLPAMSQIWVLTSVEEGAQGDRPAGFIACRRRRVEMLFVDPPFFRMGLGTILLRRAIMRMPPSRREGTSVFTEVNEQNTGAVAFWAAQGFVRLGRTARDHANHPYPLLLLRRDPKPLPVDAYGGFLRVGGK